MSTSQFLRSFDSTIPVLAMLHLKGESATDTLEIAKRETEALWESGVDAVIVENYYGSTDDVIAVCSWLRLQVPEVVFGVNVLGDDARAFEVAHEYGARFIQLDSVAGHLPIKQDAEYGEWLNAQRAASPAFVLGGVRFKYQPYLSGRSLAEDLRLGVTRADAIVVTGDGTGLTTPETKTREFRSTIGPDVPLVVGAGVTPASCATDLAVADAVVVGSYLKDTYLDTGDVDRNHAIEFVRAVRSLG